jgi:two-component system LytT family response regulator
VKPKIRTVIVDDEPLARDRIRELLKPEADIEVVGEFADGYQAVVGIAELSPDLLFLDVQLHQLDGFALLDRIGAGRLPAVIFVTAYDSYAVRAFEVHPVDYLLKPFGRERFYDALEAARAYIRQVQEAGFSDKLVSLVEEMRAGEKRYADRLLVKTGGRFVFLRVEQIDWIETSGNYLKLHCGAEEYLIRETMQNLEARLDPARFLRIHRFTMVNLERIKQVEPWFHGEYVVTLEDGKELMLSPSYRERLLSSSGRG